MDAYKDLMTEFETKTKEFRKREAEILERLNILNASQSASASVSEAKIKVLERKAEESLACGDAKALTKSQRDIEEIKKQREIEADEVRALNMELKEVQAKIVLAAKESLEEVFPSKIRPSIHQTWSDTVDIADQAWSDLERFGKETGIPVSWNIYRNALSPFSLSGSKVLQRKLEKWI